MEDFLGATMTATSTSGFERTLQEFSSLASPTLSPHCKYNFLYFKI